MPENEQTASALTALTVNGKEIGAAQGEGVKGKIGILVFATFGSMEVPMEETQAWFKAQDEVPDQVMPKPPNKMDAFANVCSPDNTDIWFEVDQKAVEQFEEMYGTKVRVQYLSLPTKDGKPEYILCRRIWVVDTNQGPSVGDVEISPEHPKIARLKFDPEGDRIVVVPFEGFKESPVIAEIERVANREYQAQKTLISGVRHRQALYRLVEVEGGVGFGYGYGCFFIPNDGEKALKGYKRYLDEVARNYGTTGHTTDIRVMPVVDTEEMREDIARDVAKEVGQRYSDLLDSTLAYLEKKKDAVDDKTLARVEKAMEERLGQAERLKILKERYEGLLGKKIKVEVAKMNLPENVSGRTKALLSQMAKLVEGDDEDVKQPDVQPSGTA